MKVIKDRQRFKSYLKKVFVMSESMERLLISVIGIIILSHVSACIWILIVSLGTSPDGWLSYYGLDQMTSLDQYVASLYLIVQTVVTVGYGDISPVLPLER